MDYKYLKNLFIIDFLFELQRINDFNIDQFENQFLKYANEYNIPLIGTNNTKFEKVMITMLTIHLLCIAQKSTINQNNRLKLLIQNYILKIQMKWKKFLMTYLK